jgi:uncharacterized coiled-coil DUF342 family protein
VDDKELKTELETMRQLIRGLRNDVHDLKRTAESFEARRTEIDGLKKMRWDVDLLEVKVKKLEEKAGGR